MHKTKTLDHVILILGSAVMIGPVAMILWLLLRGLDAAAVWEIFSTLWRDGVGSFNIPARTMMWNSLIVAVGLAALQSIMSLLAAYALAFFRLPFRNLIFGLVLMSMFFPIESRILPTFAVTNNVGLLNSYAGIILPLTASGLGVLLFSLFMKQLPPELFEAARIDGAGPMRILRDIVIPLSAPMAAALFSILFVLGWNQYVWPIMITTTTTSDSHDTLVRGMEYAGYGGRSGLALALLALLPPGVLLLVAQRWMMRGLTAGIH